MTITLNRTRDRFVDLNLLFTRHPVTRDVTTRNDVEAIKASVKNLILTKHYERPFHPDIGSRVYDLLFENFTPDVIQFIQREIELVIENYEPRATVLSVVFEDRSDMNELAISITFTTRNISDPIQLDLLIERVR